MSKFLLSIGLSLGMLFMQKEPPPNSWRGIVPLMTKRTEVETILGSPTSGSGFVLSYDTQAERITIWYAGAKSAKGNPCKWSLPSDTVINFIVAPKRTELVSELKFDLKRFEKHEDLEMKGDFYYFDEQDGITVETRLIDGKEVLGSIHLNATLVQTRKYCKSGMSQTCR